MKIAIFFLINIFGYLLSRIKLLYLISKGEFSFKKKFIYMKDIKILCTLGPASINKKFLKFASNKISILRLNMSHIEVRKLATLIKFVKKNTKTPICLDTEGAQIRTKVKKKIF